MKRNSSMTASAYSQSRWAVLIDELNDQLRRRPLVAKDGWIASRVRPTEDLCLGQCALRRSGGDHCASLIGGATPQGETELR